MKQVLLISGCSLALLAGVVVAQAQSADQGPVVQNSQAMAAADQAGAKPVAIRQQIQDQMTKAGYTDVTVTPSSFYVRAKDKKGDPVAMVIGPDSVMEVTEIPSVSVQSGVEKPLSNAELDAFLQQYGQGSTLTLPQADTAAEARFSALDLKHTGKVDQKELVPAGVDVQDFNAVNPDKDTTLEKDEYLNLVRKKFNLADQQHREALTKSELSTPAGQTLLRLLH